MSTSSSLFLINQLVSLINFVFEIHPICLVLYGIGPVPGVTTQTLPSSCPEPPGSSAAGKILANNTGIGALRSGGGNWFVGQLYSYPVGNTAYPGVMGLPGDIII